MSKVNKSKAGMSKAGKRSLLPMDFLLNAAECLKVMAHPVRLRIVDILVAGEFPVNRIAEMCGLAPNRACEHLRLLKGRGLLDSRRRGRSVFYRIAAPQLPGLLSCIRSNCPGQDAPMAEEQETEN
jgi:DNA-binding transcriptional ArsR family regulator